MPPLEHPDRPTTAQARTTNGYEASKGVPVGSIINAWVSEMSAYIKSVDKNHLVSTGQEGFQINGDCCNGHTWMNNGLIGTDWITTNTLTSTIDFATIHLYPSARRGGEKRERLRGLCNSF